jgi:hypothetical protein
MKKLLKDEQARFGVGNKWAEDNKHTNTKKKFRRRERQPKIPGWMRSFRASGSASTTVVVQFES